MRRVLSIVLVSAAALTILGGVAAATSPWATRADKVCRTWTAKAKKSLGVAPKTPSQAYAWSKRAVALERAELAALEKIPGRTPAASKAFAAIRTDIAEIETGLKDWRSGDKTGFARVFIRWQTDHRPHRAFLKAGAKDCG